MIKSMTGYGSAKGVCEGLELSLELKSVNNRYFDCGVKLPRNFLFAEEAVRAKVHEHISRGKVDVFISVASGAAGDVIISVNDALAQSYADAMAHISALLNVENDLTAVRLGRFPEVLSVEKKEADKEKIGDALSQLCGQALAEFDAMRAREGEKLYADIAGRLDAIEAMVSQVEARSPETVRAYRDRLYKKLSEVLENRAVDEQRVLTEAAIFADKVAVDEETVRLRSHIAQLRGMLESGSPIGRKMDFLVQEFNREANTIGSKCNDVEVSKIVVDLKAEIEKIREQIQNIE